MTLIIDLNTLESSGLISLVSAQPELEYLFRHALVQEAAYSSLLKRDRKQLHLGVGQALERLYPDKRSELAATLAYHFERAEVRDKAIDYLTLAGDRAQGGYANTEAMAFYRAAISQVERILSKVNEQPENWLGKLARLFESLADSLELTGQHEASRDAYQQALTALTQLEQPDRIGQARLYRKIGFTLTVSSQYAEAQQVWDQAENILGQPPSEQAASEHTNGWWQEWIEIQVERIWNRYWQSDTDRMERLCEKAQPVMEQYGTPVQRSRVLSALTLMRLRRDRYVASDETMAVGQNALTEALATDNPGLVCDAQFELGFIHLWRRELEQAEEKLQAATSLAERTGDVVRLSRCVNYLMCLARMRGQVAETRGYIPRVLSVAWAGPVNYVHVAKANLAWIAWREGNLTEAREQGRASMGLLQGPLAALPFKWFALWPLIGVALAEENISEAIEHARELLSPTQMRLPNALTAALEEAIKAGAQNQVTTAQAQLDRAMSLAEKEGYL